MDLVGNAVRWIINTFVGLLEYVVLTFPDMPESYSVFPPEVLHYAYWVGNIIDTTALSFVIGTIIFYELAMVLVRVSLWVWRLLPLT